MHKLEHQCRLDSSADSTSATCAPSRLSDKRCWERNTTDLGLQEVCRNNILFLADPRPSLHKIVGQPRVRASPHGLWRGRRKPLLRRNGSIAEGHPNVRNGPGPGSTVASRSAGHRGVFPLPELPGCCGLVLRLASAHDSAGGDETDSGRSDPVSTQSRGARPRRYRALRRDPHSSGGPLFGTCPDPGFTGSPAERAGHPERRFPDARIEGLVDAASAHLQDGGEGPRPFSPGGCVAGRPPARSRLHGGRPCCERGIQ